MASRASQYDKNFVIILIMKA